MVSFIQYINRIQFGYGALGQLGGELQLLNVRRPLVMTDAGVVAAGLLDKLLAALPDREAAVLFTDCPRHPTEAAAARALASMSQHGADGIIALGGGAVIDLAKGVALLGTHPGPIGQYSTEQNGSGRIGAYVTPVIAVPTTAGTGSEIGRGAGIALGDGGVKAVFLSVNLVPKVAICDPELTLGLPPVVTAGTGIDALGHCLEAYLSPAINPPVDAIALDGIRRLARWLKVAVQEPSNRDARWNTMMGALEGGMCFWKGLGPAHALSIPLDAYDLHHGTLVGLLLAGAVALARPAAPEKIAELDRIFGGPAEDALRTLYQDIGLPSRLQAMGVPGDVLDEIAQAASASVFNRTAPRPGSQNDYRAMLDAVY